METRRYGVGAAGLRSVMTRRPATVIKSHYVTLTASLALRGPRRARCVGRDAHVMSGTEIADEGISRVFGWQRRCRNVGDSFFKRRFSVIREKKKPKQDEMSAEGRGAH